jgi:predicted nucleic acid-binding protein
MITTPSRFVLDSFALIALLKNEPAADRVSGLLTRAAAGLDILCMSLINLGEVHYQTIRDTNEERAAGILSEIERLPISFFDADRSQVRTAALLKARHPMSYADCFAAALGIQLDAAVVTGDPEFRQVEHLVRIEWLPAPQ